MVFVRRPPGHGRWRRKGYEAAVFDGRYRYFAPYTGNPSGIVARFDTQGDFAVATSWTTFDTKTNVDANAKGFAGGAFDGRYVYFAPRGGNGNVVTRYDTHVDFATASSWQTFTSTTVDPNASGYVGAVFDGHYIYFVPYNDAANLYDGVVLRYDTTANFQTVGSWKTYDAVANVNPNAKGFYGGVFDGRYVYLVPWLTASGTYGSLVTRLDTTADFQTAASWATYDTTKNDANAKGFSGGAFDGRYLYFVPSQAGVAARYDTKADFAAAPSWTTYDITQANAHGYGFDGATFDGRYVYFAPYKNGPTYAGAIARVDTTADFAQSASWSFYDMTAQGGTGFVGAAFDGRFVYAIPCVNDTGFLGKVFRFDAKSPASMPNLYGSSPVKYLGSFL